MTHECPRCDSTVRCEHPYAAAAPWECAWCGCVFYLTKAAVIGAEPEAVAAVDPVNGGVRREDARNMTAREKFTVNQPVRLSKKGKEALQWMKMVQRDDHAIVRGFGRDPAHIRIQRDGCTSVDAFHMDFWEPIDD